MGGIKAIPVHTAQRIDGRRNSDKATRTTRRNSSRELSCSLACEDNASRIYYNLPQAVAFCPNCGLSSPEDAPYSNALTAVTSSLWFFDNIRSHPRAKASIVADESITSEDAATAACTSELASGHPLVYCRVPAALHVGPSQQSLSVPLACLDSMSVVAPIQSRGLRPRHVSLWSMVMQNRDTW